MWELALRIVRGDADTRGHISVILDEVCLTSAQLKELEGYVEDGLLLFKREKEVQQLLGQP
jgi:hypothetical protein